jgi:hypothetical protein
LSSIHFSQQACFGLDGVGQTPLAQGYAGGFGTAVLPDDGVVQGQTRAPVPHHGGFSLVGDAQRLHLTGGDAGLGQGFAGRGQLGAPDLLWVVLHPARLWVNLR